MPTVKNAMRSRAQPPAAPGTGFPTPPVARLIAARRGANRLSEREA
jgi:hypothetical protein